MSEVDVLVDNVENGDDRETSRRDESGEEEEEEESDLEEVKREFEETMERMGVEEEDETNKNGECVVVQISESHEAGMKDMLKDLMEMSRSVALGQGRTESRDLLL